MKRFGLLLGVIFLGATSVFANFNSNLIDPAMMTNYLPESQVDRNNPESIARNFQAQMIKQMFLQPAIGDQMTMFEDEENEFGTSIHSEYANEMLMHYMAQDMAKKDMLGLNKVLNRGLNPE